VWLLWSRSFFRHLDRQNWLMSYIDVICVTRYQMTHMKSNDAYNIKIGHRSIWPILVSKEASGPQQSHLCIRFWLNNCFKIQKLKSWFGIFFLYKFWESFVFLAQKYHSRGGPSNHLSEIILMFLESVEHREWE
jgi:hypothetical protein